MRVWEDGDSQDVAQTWIRGNVYTVYNHELLYVDVRACIYMYFRIVRS